MTKTISPELQALIDASVETDLYETADELIKATRTQLTNPQTQEALRNAWLKRQLELSDADSGGRPYKEVFNEIRADVDALKSSV